MVNNDNDLITNTVRTRETTVRISRMVWMIYQGLRKYNFYKHFHKQHQDYIEEWCKIFLLWGPHWRNILREGDNLKDASKKSDNV
jgi:hypothetical protein